MAASFPDWASFSTYLLDWPLFFCLVFLGGEGLFRFLKLPRIAGYAILGLILGPSAFGLLSFEKLQIIRPLVNLGFGLLLFELGYRLSFQWFKANPWVIVSSLFEAGLTFLAMFGVFVEFIAPHHAMMVASVAMATSPISIVCMAQETKATGQVTERMLTLAALSSIYAVLVFKWLFVHFQVKQDEFFTLWHSVYLVMGSILLPALLTLIAKSVIRLFRLSNHLISLLFLGLLALLVGGVQFMGLSLVIAALVFGAFIRHSIQPVLSSERTFGAAGMAFMLLLFAYMGAWLNWRSILEMGWMFALIIIGVRALSKIVGVTLLAVPSLLAPRKAVLLGISLMPMSIMTVLLLDNPRAIYPDFATATQQALMSAAIILEVIGPIATLFALRKAKETAGE